MYKRSLVGKIRRDRVSISAGQQIDYNYENSSEHWLEIARFLLHMGSESKTWRIIIEDEDGNQYTLYDTTDTTTEFQIPNADHPLGIRLAPRDHLIVSTNNATSDMYLDLMLYEIN